MVVCLGLLGEQLTVLSWVWLNACFDGECDPFWMRDSCFLRPTCGKNESKNVASFSNVAPMWLHSQNMHCVHFQGIH